MRFPLGRDHRSVGVFSHRINLWQRTTEQEMKESFELLSQLRHGLASLVGRWREHDPKVLSGWQLEWSAKNDIRQLQNQTQSHHQDRGYDGGSRIMKPTSTVELITHDSNLPLFDRSDVSMTRIMWSAPTPLPNFHMHMGARRRWRQRNKEDKGPVGSMSIEQKTLNNKKLMKSNWKKVN